MSQIDWKRVETEAKHLHTLSQIHFSNKTNNLHDVVVRISMHTTGVINFMYSTCLSCCVYVVVKLL